MADPLSITASVIGITTAALFSLRKLRDFIGKIKDAPPVIAAIKADLDNIDAVMTSLQKTLEDPNGIHDELKPLLQDLRIQRAVETCGKTCSKFEATLTHWMRHSTEEKVHWWDRVRAGYFGDAKIRAFTSEFGTCKATISLALGAATLYVLRR